MAMTRLMRIFVTGATGFVGSAIVPELLAAGHQVIALARSDAAASKLASAGVQVHRGSIENPESLASGAATADAVIHTAFIHDFANFAASCDTDRRAIETLGTALAGSRRPMLVTSGTGLLAPGRTAVEDDLHATGPDAFPRVATEEAAATFAAGGVRIGVVRLAPSVHGPDDHGFVPHLIEVARKTGVSAYIGDGANRWPAVHRLDAGRLYRLAIESDFTPGTRFHGVAEEGVPFREIAEAIARGLGIPTASKTRDEAQGHFEWFVRFAGLDAPASSARTQERLGWRPTHPGLLADLGGPGYFAR